MRQSDHGEDHDQDDNNDYYQRKDQQEGKYDEGYYSSSFDNSSASLSSNSTSSSFISNDDYAYSRFNEKKTRGYKGSSTTGRKQNRSKHNRNQLWQEQGQDIELLTREELYELPARELRKKCRLLGLDASRVVEKEGLVLLIHEFYRRQSAERNFQSDTFSHISTSPMRRHHGGLHTTTGAVGKMQTHNMMSNLPMFNDENEQMIEILFEIMPYYGQGDPSIDPIVKDTIQRLPIYCLESRDKVAGNTLIMLASQVGALDLVLTLLSKGSDINAQNWNGETCLHFACYSDSYSPDIAKVSEPFDIKGKCVLNFRRSIVID